MKTKKSTISEFVSKRNNEKYLFTPGPASLLAENIAGLRPCFGRGDKDYEQVESSVLKHLQSMSNHEFIARLQGSASLALEIMAHNFLTGQVLIVSSGFYSGRLETLARNAKLVSGHIDNIDSVDWKELDKVQESYDWIWACPTETSKGLKLPIQWLFSQAERLGAKLMLDATASIGLEGDHDLAEVIGYSSCKGLFGLTGAAFIAFNSMPDNRVNSFYLNIQNHLNRKMTGPYHAIASLLEVLPMHSEFREAVVINKQVFCEKMADYLVHDNSHQPLLCTYISKQLNAANDKVVLYQSRGDNEGQVLSHLGEVHLAGEARGDILNNLEIELSTKT